MATVFIAGAGCSVGTLKRKKQLRPPIAKDFVRDPKNRVKDWRTEFPEITEVINHLDKTPHRVGLEELWTCVDLHAKFPDAFPVSWTSRAMPVVWPFLRLSRG
jgi:hypothetical protein